MVFKYTPHDELSIDSYWARHDHLHLVLAVQLVVVIAIQYSYLGR